MFHVKHLSLCHFCEEKDAHIRTLFHPWQPGDGYDEAEIEAAEARLGLRLPNPLRRF